MSTVSPSPTTREDRESLRNRLRSAGQDHVFRFWGKLDEAARNKLAEQAESIDLDLLARLERGEITVGDVDMEGALEPVEVLGVDEEPKGCTREDAFRRGEKLLRAGRVGVLLVAGGQGSRLGFAGPKGCLPVGALSDRTLFEIHAGKLRRLARQYGASIPWYIMTSQANDASTRRFFEANDWFGLDPDDVSFLPQAMLPALDENGKLILQSRDSIFTSPNGHGGCFDAMARHGALDAAAARGIKHLFYFQVDNPLVRVAHPELVGLHDILGCQMSLAVLEKTGPEEKIGVVARLGGRPVVVEYSDLPEREARRRDDSGKLTYWAGSIAIHVFSLDFVREVAEGSIQLPYHVARKEITALDEEGKETKITGRKFETFVFDALPAASEYLNFEVVREQEFAPIKNREGIDSLPTAQGLMIEEHRRWLARSGIEAHGQVEISSLAAGGWRDLVEPLSEHWGHRFQQDVRVEWDEEDGIVIETIPGRESTDSSSS